MGMAASQARFLTLTARQNNLEYQVQQVNEQRTVYANGTLALYQQIATLGVPITSDSKYNTGEEFNQDLYNQDMVAFQAQLSKYNAEEARLQTIDKKFEMELKNLDTQHQAVQTEIDAVKKVIDKNIDMTFKTFA